MTTAAGGFERSHVAASRAGEGGIVSTVDDMLRWLAHMDAPIVGSVATWTLMKTPQILANGIPTDYGLGLLIGRYRGVETLGHAGGRLGGRSQMLKVPAAGLDIIVMVNRQDKSGTLLAYKIIDACLLELKPAVEPSTGPFTSGVFCSPTTGRVVQLDAKEGQQIAVIDGADVPVEPDTEGVLRPIAAISHVKQAVKIVGDALTPASIQFSEFGNLDNLARMEPAVKSDFAAIAGRYRSDAANFEAVIEPKDDSLRLRTVGRFGSADSNLECLACGIWRSRSLNPATGLGGFLVFESDKATFRFFTGRTRGLPFRRVS